MKILKTKMVNDPGKSIRIIFDFEHGGIIFSGWKIIQADNSSPWVAPPRVKDFESEKFVSTVHLPPNVRDELDALALATYEKVRR